MVSSDKVEDWFFLDETGSQSGPHLRETLMLHWRAGKLTGETFVWTPGMEQWTAFRTVFPTLTPPPPPERMSSPQAQAATTNPSPSAERESEEPERDWWAFVVIVVLSVLLRFFIDNIYRYDFYFLPSTVSVTEFAEAIGFALIPLLIAAFVFYRFGGLAAALTAFLIIGPLSLMQVRSEMRHVTGSAHFGAIALPSPAADPARHLEFPPATTPAIDQPAARIVCLGPGNALARIRLAGRIHNGVQLNCIDGDFVRDSTGCAPRGGFALHTPTGAAAIGELVSQLSPDLQHTGVAIGNSIMGEHIDFTANYLSGGDGSPPALIWYFGVNRTTGAGRLMTPDRNADYLCRAE